MKHNSVLKKIVALVVCLALAGIQFAAVAAETEPMKYDPEITLTVGWAEQNDINLGEDESYSNNAWTKLYKEVLGINLEASWVSPMSQFEQKVNLALTTNDLPDLLVTRNFPNLYLRLVSSGKVQDLTDLFEEYATDEVKAEYYNYPDSMNAAKIDGRLYGIPHLQNPYDYAAMLFYRTDWLEALGLAEPTSMEELIDVIKAFANEDPDGNGEKDTYGIALQKDLYGSVFSLTGFVAGFGAYPDAWIDDGNGGLVYGSVQPAMRDALLALQDLYFSGAIDPEFGVKNTDKVVEDVTSGMLGVESGAWWNPQWPLGYSRDTNPDAEWTGLAPLKVGGGIAKPSGKAQPQGYFVVTSECEHPEALILMLNEYHDKSVNARGEERETYFHSNIDDYNRLAFIDFQGMEENFNAYLHVNAALEANDESLLLNPSFELPIYTRMKAYIEEGNMDGWGEYTSYKRGGSVEILYNISQNGPGLELNRLTIPGTETMESKWTTLYDMEKEVFTRVILGADISEFDDFVARWAALGGDQITQEVNDWYAGK